MLRFILLLSSLFSISVFASTPIHLQQKSTTILSSVQFKEINRISDFKNTLHIRMQQTYQGYDVFGADFIIHIPHGDVNQKSFINMVTPDTSMSGVIYQGIVNDLPKKVTNDAKQKVVALEHAISLYQKKFGVVSQFERKQVHLLVYVDKDNKAHWAYLISFYVPPYSGRKPLVPTYILDANHFTIYEAWNDLKTAEEYQNVAAGGFGGNDKIGKLVYDGLKNKLNILDMQRDAKNICYMQNDYVELHNYMRSGDIETFKCDKTDAQHNNLYWDGARDEINGAYSQSHDALFGAKVINHLYHDWFNAPVWVDEAGKPAKMAFSIHVFTNEGSFWDNGRVYLCDNMYEPAFYPFSSLGVVAHEIHHGVTAQHSKLNYRSQSGCINEAFSDMSSQAAEYYANGSNSWLFGYGDIRAPGMPLRYLDQPSKDCAGGGMPMYSCSVDSAKDYIEYDDDFSGKLVHFGSGVFNRAFYLLATSANWDVKKAFTVMYDANVNYWTSNTTFAQAACGVLNAAKDRQYDLNGVKQAFNGVGVDMSKC